MMTPRKKRYQHYKGGIYTYLGSARHSETLESCVVYRNEAGKWWVRPEEMFHGHVTLADGTQVKRFQLLD